MLPRGADGDGLCWLDAETEVEDPSAGMLLRAAELTGDRTTDSCVPVSYRTNYNVKPNRKQS